MPACVILASKIRGCFLPMFSRKSVRSLSLTLLGGISLISSAYAAEPAWWAEQGVKTGGAQPDDYAAANIGQLKHMASKAAALIHARFPEGEGAAISTLISSWSTAAVNPARDDYAVLNQGQLKAVAKKFYFRLNELGYHASNLPAGRIYPWTETDSSDDDNYAAANLGQLKYVFSFILINLKDPAASIIDSDGDGISNADEATLGLLANDADWDDDGLPDGWEVAFGYNPKAGDQSGDADGDHLSTLLEYLNHRNPAKDDQDVASKLAAGGGFILLTTDNGGLQAWGDNRARQSAVTGGTPFVAVRTPVSGAPVNVVAIAAGERHSVAVTKSGAVYTWGDNEFGQLGTGDHTGRAAPTLVAGLSDIVQVAAGEAHSLALRGDGTVWAWGSNHSGQLGLQPAEVIAPVQIPASLIGSATPVLRIAAGARHSLALDGQGRVFAWGDNAFGQLGNATVAQSASPMQVSGLPPIRELAAGRHHALALTATGAAWAWGANYSGQLGIGNRIGVATPQIVGGGLTFRALVAGARHSLGITATGTLQTWGANERGQLGLGADNLNDQLAPVGGPALGTVERIAGGAANTVALCQDLDGVTKVIKGWGDNRGNRLGTAPGTPDLVGSPLVIYAP